MEVVSTRRITSGFVLTEDAMQLIQELVDLDSSHRQDKVQLFKRLYDLWENDFLRGNQAKEQFERNEKFIKETIESTLSEKEKEEMRKVEEIYDNLKIGFPYSSSTGDIIIPYNAANVDKYKIIRKNYHDKINKRFRRLLDEFCEYVRDRQNESTLFAPVELSKRGLDREAKAKAITEGYPKSNSKNTEGKKKNRKRISVNAAESDEVNINYSINL